MDKSKERRASENQDLIERMKRGEDLKRVDANATWFPPRPIIVKDFKEMARVLGHKRESGGNG